MVIDIESPEHGLPSALRTALVQARREHGWSQAELGKRARMPQPQISGIETGKIMPRFDTLQDLIRVLEFELILVPRKLVPVVQALVAQESGDPLAQEEDQEPLYTGQQEKEVE